MSQDPRPDRLVQRLVSDPSTHQPSVVFSGFLGEAASDDAWRLYLTPQLDEYIEFPKDALLHTESARGEDASGTTVWLSQGTPLQHTVIASRQVQADFLQGDLTRGGLTGGAVSLARYTRPETGYACTRNYVCSINPHIPACQLRTENCGSAFCPPGTGALCPTGPFIEGC
jgi:hypothetical protein